MSVPDHDILFAGQLIPRKQPMFFAEVAGRIRAQRGHCRALILGSGPLERQLLEALDAAGVQWTYPGFVQPADLPSFFGRAKVFLFPTLEDTWGVVANEACAAGLPVITTPHAGCANDLIIDGENGYVLPLDATSWAARVVDLLDNRDLYSQFAERARELVSFFSHDRAAQGILDAVAYARSGAL
jgi:glycosyltransferase involved in cell wall biosynthesis